tara:strand:- start:177 stop:344 length:168 start_codon:yes stop_codon:yes gene_type:complete
VKVGDLIYDSHLGLRAIVIKIHACAETSSYMTVLYENGKLTSSMRTNDPDLEVVQ